MALPRFLYSVSESVHEDLLAGLDDVPDESIGISPGRASGGGLTGLQSKGRREIANSPPNLPPSFIGSRSPVAGTDGDALRREYEYRREREFVGEAETMELSEPGGALNSDGSDSSESGILETMGETRPPKRNGQRNSSSGEGINDGTLGTSRSNGARSSNATQHRSSATSSDPGNMVYYPDDERTKWEEAALFIREGEDNSKFFHHPKGRWSKRAFNVVHHPVYYLTHLFLTVLLMLLALLETPPSTLEEGARTAVLSVHSVLELAILSFLAFDIVLRYMWFRRRQFFHHRRTLVITVILIVMYAEAITVLARQENHFRITRAARPIFFIDNYLLNGVRRVIRQIFQSFKAIFDVLLLLLFIVVIFALMSYYIFAEIDPSYFLNFKRSLISLFIAMTTANHPDLMLEAYFEQYASPLFFILYMVLTVYCVNNVLLAVVYSSFSDANKRKFKKLFLHKRKALRLAYNTLATTSRGIEFHDFLAFMQYYRPQFPEWRVMCIFKALHEDPHQQHQEISLEDFYGFYELRDLKWKQTREDGRTLYWFDKKRFLSKLRHPIKACHKLVKNRVFNICINLIVLLNVVFLVTYSLAVDGDTVEDSRERFTKLSIVRPVSFVFVIIYILEIVLRVIGVGFYDYFRKAWNTVDFVIVMASFLFLIVEVWVPAFALWRPVKLFRLLRLKRRHRDIMDTIVDLVPRLVSVGLLVVVIYYVFAIVGIETLHDRVYPGCCSTSLYSVGDYYKGNYTSGVDVPAAVDVFYVLSFDDILRSYVTLFSLMVINNWFVIMEGFASEVRYDWLARLYFMFFVIIAIIVLQVIISFIVEAFVFKIQAKERSRACSKHHVLRGECGCDNVAPHKKSVTIQLVPADIIKLRYEVTYTDERQTGFDVSTSIMKFSRVPLSDIGSMTYVGRRRTNKDDIQLLMHRKLLVDWIKEEKEMKAKQEQLETMIEKKWWQKALKVFKNFVEYVIE